MFEPCQKMALPIKEFPWILTDFTSIYGTTTSITVLIYGLLFTVTIFISWPMYLGITHYEKFNGDPQKRGLLNKMASIFLLSSVLDLTTQIFANGMRALVGPLGPILAFFLTWFHQIFLSCSQIMLGTSMMAKTGCNLIPKQIEKIIVKEFWNRFFIRLCFLASLIIGLFNAGYCESGNFHFLNGIFPGPILSGDKSKPPYLQGNFNCILTYF